MRSVLFRAREWTAERFNSAQYPPQRIAPRQPGLFGWRFKHQMNWEVRFGLVVFAILVLLFCAVAAVLLGVFFWAVITS